MGEKCEGKNVFFLERTGILILLLPSAMHCAELTGNWSDQWGSCSQLVIFFLYLSSHFFPPFTFFFIMVTHYGTIMEAYCCHAQK